MTTTTAERSTLYFDECGCHVFADSTAVVCGFCADPEHERKVKLAAAHVVAKFGAHVEYEPALPPLTITMLKAKARRRHAAAE